MYGHGIGSLNVYVRGGQAKDRKIWGLTGDAGNNWYMGQEPIASTETFRVSRALTETDCVATYSLLFLSIFGLETSEFTKEGGTGHGQNN